MGEDPFITIIEVLAATGRGRMGVEFAVTICRHIRWRSGMLGICDGKLAYINFLLLVLLEKMLPPTSGRSGRLVPIAVKLRSSDMT